MKRKTNVYVYEKGDPKEWTIDYVASGEVLKAKRINRSWTQEQLSIILEGRGVNACRVTISNWERGFCFPSIETLKVLAVLYHCTLDDLIVTFADEEDDAA